jgi:hypothetical protein
MYERHTLPVSKNAHEDKRIVKTKQIKYKLTKTKQKL